MNEPLRPTSDGGESEGQTSFTLPKSRYDVLLALMPLPFIVGIVVTLLTAISIQLTMLLASIVGVIVMVDVLFINPPLDDTSELAD